MLELFLEGGPLMWPLLLVSVATLSVVFERLLFLARESRTRQPAAVEALLRATEAGALEEAVAAGRDSSDSLARSLALALEHREESFTNAMLRAASRDMKRFHRGLPVLDTAITLAPLLGLLGTVTGMIHAFGLLGAQELDAPAAITGGIAQALIATAFGLGIAITALIPFNFLNAKLEERRHELEDTASRVELLLLRHRGIGTGGREGDGR
jgi:biopolymer transport protein ExbB